MEDRLRIPFARSSANADRQTFQDYMDGIITAKTGAYLIGLHNGIEVTEEQFLANVKWLGYEEKDD